MKSFLNFFAKLTAPATATSEFSRFFREASSGEKKRVFLDVAREASEDQRKVIESTQVAGMHLR